MHFAGGHQPLSNEDGTIWAVLNGEIYNTLTSETPKGARARVRSRADTEIWSILYEDYGDQMVHALEGMFAFAIWDERRGRLLLGRDRFGQKPLFIRPSQGELTFASELSPLVGTFERRPDLGPRRARRLHGPGLRPRARDDRGGHTPVATRLPALLGELGADDWDCVASGRHGLVRAVTSRSRSWQRRPCGSWNAPWRRRGLRRAGRNLPQRGRRLRRSSPRWSRRGHPSRLDFTVGHDVGAVSELAEARDTAQ